MSKVPPLRHGTFTRHEFECPIHGRFEALVPFKESPPKSHPCKEMVPHGKRTPEHGQTTMMCCEDSPWHPPRVGVVWPGGKPSAQR